jgi:hypothetical protein
MENAYIKAGLINSFEEIFGEPVPMPVEPFGIEAVHIDSPATPAECETGKKKPVMEYWGGMNVNIDRGNDAERRMLPRKRLER